MWTLLKTKTGCVPFLSDLVSSFILGILPDDEADHLQDLRQLIIKETKNRIFCRIVVVVVVAVASLDSLHRHYQRPSTELYRSRRLLIRGLRRLWSSVAYLPGYNATKYLHFGLSK